MRKATKATKRKTTTTRAVRPGAKAWSPADIRQLVSMYKNQTAQEVANNMGRSLASVKAKIRTLNLKKDPAAKRRAAARRRAENMGSRGGTTRRTTARKGGATKRASRTRTSGARNGSRRTMRRNA